MGPDAKSSQSPSAATLEGAAHAALDLEPSPEGPTPEAPAKDATAQTSKGRPTLAAAAILLMLAAGAASAVLGLYSIAYAGNLLAAILLLLLAATYLLGGRGLWKDESWGWGAGMFGGVLAILFALVLPLLAVVVAVLGIAAMVLLFVVREDYGMVRFDPKEEERRKKELEAARTRNPEGLHCPHCGSTALWVAPDGSAWCTSCKRGVISIRPAA